MKRIFGLLAALTPVVILMLWSVPAAGAVYADVPDNALGAEVRKAAEYGLMNGFSDTVFGYSAPVTRAQFVTALDRMLLSDERGASSLPETMKLPETLSDVYRSALSRAVACGVADPSVPFRAEDFITREEMAEMLVRALGLNDAAISLPSEYAAPFRDLPKGREGYASIAYAIGMTKGVSGGAFNPDGTATRAQAAAMLVRVYEKLHQETDFRHGFVSSDAKIESAKRMDAVSLEWSQMTWKAANAILAHSFPDGYETIVKTLTDSGVKLYLSVFMDTSDGVRELLADKTGRTQAVEQILRELTASYSALGRNPYSGVTIDFEGLHREQNEQFTNFLSELKAALSSAGKGLYVCVAPYVSDGHWDDGYDCRAIAAIADKLILMAYGYESDSLNNFLGTEAYQNAAPAPADDVYLSLRNLTEAVPDTSKLLLGFRFRYAAWEVGPDGRLISGDSAPVTADALERYLRRPNTEIVWAFSEQMPYAIYGAPQGVRYVVWYENAKSVRKKTEIARLAGVTGVSYGPLSQAPSGLF